MKKEIILILKDLNKKSILKKFNSLKNEFSDFNFQIISYKEDRSYDEIIHFLPSWILKIGDYEDIVEGDVLTSPLRSLIKEKLRKASVNYVKK